MIVTFLFVTAVTFTLLLLHIGLCSACVPVVVDAPLDAAGAETEADGVSDMTKQLEKQAIEEKEKEEDGEEGECLTLDTLQVNTTMYS